MPYRTPCAPQSLKQHKGLLSIYGSLKPHHQDRPTDANEPENQISLRTRRNKSTLYKNREQPYHRSGKQATRRIRVSSVSVKKARHVPRSQRQGTRSFLVGKQTEGSKFAGAARDAIKGYVCGRISYPIPPYRVAGCSPFGPEPLRPSARGVARSRPSYRLMAAVSYSASRGPPSKQQAIRPCTTSRPRKTIKSTTNTRYNQLRGELLLHRWFVEPGVLVLGETTRHLNSTMLVPCLDCWRRGLRAGGGDTWSGIALRTLGLE